MEGDEIIYEHHRILSVIQIFYVINNILYYYTFPCHIYSHVYISFFLLPYTFLALPWPQIPFFLYISFLPHIHSLPHIHPSTSQTPSKLVRIPIQLIFEVKIWCSVSGEWDTTWKPPQKEPSIYECATLLTLKNMTDFDLKYAVPSSYKINNSWGWNVQHNDYS